MEYPKNKGMYAGAQPELFIFAKELRLNMTASETKLWKELQKKPLDYKFRRQHPFSNYILDFYCHKSKLAIEIDGGYHNKFKQKKLDKLRTLEIERLGLKELRFTNEEVLNNMDDVLKKILDSCLSF